MKAQRQQAILELIRQQAIDTQDGLARALAQMVFEGEEWRKGDEGVLSRAEIRTALFEKYPVFQSEIGKLLDQAEEILTEYAFNTAVLQKLKEQGFGVYYLSNTNEPAFSHMISTCRFFRWMDGGVASFRCRLLKPSRAIFDFFLKHFFTSNIQFFNF